MRVAIATSEQSVCPRLDCADQLVLLEIGCTTGWTRRVIDLRGWSPHGRGARIAGLGVHRLVCGALSRLDEAGLRDGGAELVCGVSGPVEAVVMAVESGALAPEHNYW